MRSLPPPDRTVPRPGWLTSTRRQPSRAGDPSGVTEVDVNEQNASAVDFYTRRGFAVVGRRDSDDEGRPYPLLHLRLTPSVQPTASLRSAPFDKLREPG